MLSTRQTKSKAWQEVLCQRLSSWCSALIVSGSLVYASNLFAGDAAPQIVSRGIPHDMLYDVSFEGIQGVAVGDSGLIMETADGGLTWSKLDLRPNEFGLFSVVRKQGKCIAVGQSGRILYADDCKKWVAAPVISAARLLSVGVNSAGIAYAVGGFGTVLKSNDWGKSWQAVSVNWQSITADGAEPHLYDVHVADDGEVTMVGEFELILRSRDGGIKWTKLNQGKRSLFGVTVLDNGEIYAVGQEGVVLKSIDRGAKWIELKTGTQSILTGVWADQNGQIVISGIYTILYSSNAGKTWRFDKSKIARTGSHQAVVGMQKSNGQLIALLVGSGGAILSVHP